MSQDPRNVRDRIPEFATRQEEAEFWDTHDFADYWDEWEAVDVEFSDDLSSCVAIPLDTDSIIKVSALAGEKGVSLASLMRSWILERLEDAAPTQRE